MILGIATDPVFGPLLMAGVGGVTVEVAKDVAFRVVPITTEDADEMIDSLRGVRLLEAFRGRAPLHRDALRDALLRLGRLVEDFHGIVEADINPFMVAPTAEASMAVDGRIRIDPAAFR
jgi:acetyltransferase